MKLLFPFRRQRSDPGNQNELAGILKAATSRLAEFIAVRLRRREERLSLTQKKIVIASFCLIMGTYSMTLLYRGFWGHPPPASQYLSPGRISQPCSPVLPDSIRFRPRSPASGIVTFPHSIDSLTK